MDLAKRKGIKIDIAELERELGVPIVAVNPRKEKGIPQLKKTIEQTALQLYQAPARDFIENKRLAAQSIEDVQKLFPALSDYTAIHYLMNHESFDLNNEMQDTIENIERKHNFNPTKTQAEEILQRYGHIKRIMQVAVSEPDPLQKTLFTERLDDILASPQVGLLYLIGGSIPAFSKCVLAGAISHGLDRFRFRKIKFLSFICIT